MARFSMILVLALVSFSWPAHAALEDICAESMGMPAGTKARLNSRLADPAYKVIVLARHGKASEVNKFTAEERRQDPAKVALDIQRPLKKKGRKAAASLSKLLGRLTFRDVGMWGSHALRVRETAAPTMAALGNRVKIAEFEEGLYYVDVAKEMQARLTSPQGEALPHGFFWGHGKSTLAVYLRLTGATKGFLPTAATVIVALKAANWAQVFDGSSEQVEAYAWSPKNTLEVEGGDNRPAYLESVLESATPERMAGDGGDDLGEFELTVLR